MEPRLKTIKTFVEGVGWDVKEVPEDSPLAVGSTVVPGSAPEPPLPVKIVAGDVPLSLAQEVLKAAGFVAVPLEAIERLPKSHQEALNRAASNAPAAIDDAALVEKISFAESMEELTNLVAGCTSQVVLAAAEEKAAELTA